MKIHIGIILLAFTVMTSVQGWTLNEIINLKVAVAQLSQRLDLLTTKQPHIAQTQ
jgi:hypothetical protein